MSCSDALSALDLFIAFLFRDVAHVMLRSVALIAASDLLDRTCLLGDAEEVEAYTRSCHAGLGMIGC